MFVYSASSSTISENCSYIQNPGFPSVYSATSTATYTINKCSSDVCDVRLDFETFNIVGPASTEEPTGGVCTDSFVLSSVRFRDLIRANSNYIYVNDALFCRPHLALNRQRFVVATRDNIVIKLFIHV